MRQKRIELFILGFQKEHIESFFKDLENYIGTENLKFKKFNKKLLPKIDFFKAPHANHKNSHLKVKSKVFTFVVTFKVEKLKSTLPFFLKSLQQKKGISISFKL